MLAGGMPRVLTRRKARQDCLALVASATALLLLLLLLLLAGGRHRCRSPWRPWLRPPLA